MACTGGGTWWYIDAWARGDYVDAVSCPYIDQLGLGLASVMLLGMINGGLYARTGHWLIPFVITLIMSGLALNQAASLFEGLVVMLILMVGGIGPVILVRRIQLV